MPTTGIGNEKRGTLRKSRPIRIKKFSAFKSTPFLVDGASVAPSMLVTNSFVLIRKDLQSQTKIAGTL